MAMFRSLSPELVLRAFQDAELDQHP
jgi:hypothetical protein